MQTLVRLRAERPARPGSRRRVTIRPDFATPFSTGPGPELERPRPGAVGGHILVVDDEPSLRLLCAVNLGMAGFTVGEAENGERAIELAASGAFDLVLLDVMLPDIGGHEVARRIAARPDSTPIAFFSARAGVADIRAGYETGGVDYITKPFDPLGLAGRIAGILERVARGEGDAFRRARLAELNE